MLSPEGFRVYLADSLAHEYYGANKAIATLATAKKEPTKFARLVELQQACDAVEWALEDEAAAAREHDSGKS